MLDEADEILIPVERSSWLGPGRMREVMFVSSVFSQHFASSQLQYRLAVAPALPSLESLSMHTAYGAI